MSAPVNPELLPIELLRDVNQSLSLLLGCLAPEDRMGQLSRVMSRAAVRIGAGDAAALCRRIVKGHVDQALLEELATELLPGETYFFRDQPSMSALQQELIPRLLQERRGEKRLNIWSAACSTGEEPLTLAVLLHECMRGLAGWKIRILGTDLRARALAMARGGRYREWSFRDCPAWIRDRYFAPQGAGVWTASPEILGLVEYRQFNLVRDAFPPPHYPAGGFDLILCRNVLIYLDSRRIMPLLEQMCNCLAEGGWLLVSAVESAAVDLERFECIRLGETLFFRKRSATPLPHGERTAGPDESLLKPAALPSRHLPPPARRWKNKTPSESEQAEKHSPAPESKRLGLMDVEQYLNQAAQCLEQGDLITARSLVRQALYLDRYNAMAHLLEGRLRQAEGQRFQARRSFQAALKLLERAPPDQKLDYDRQSTAAELAAMVREMLSRLNDRC